MIVCTWVTQSCACWVRVCVAGGVKNGPRVELFVLCAFTRQTKKNMVGGQIQGTDA